MRNSMFSSGACDDNAIGGVLCARHCLACASGSSFMMRDDELHRDAVPLPHPRGSTSITGQLVRVQQAAAVGQRLLQSGRIRRLDGGQMFEDTSAMFEHTGVSEIGDEDRHGSGDASVAGSASSVHGHASAIAEVQSYKIVQRLRTDGASPGRGRVHVTVPVSMSVDESGATHTGYGVRVVAGGREWEVTRRYREFREIHAALHASDAPLSAGERASLPPLPPKKYAGSMSPAFVEERRRALEAYLQAVTQIPSALNMPEVVRFLDEPMHTPLAVHLAITSLSARVEVLESAYDEAQVRFAAYEDVILSQRDVIVSMQSRIHALESVIAEAALQTPSSVSALRSHSMLGLEDVKPEHARMLTAMTGDKHTDAARGHAVAASAALNGQAGGVVPAGDIGRIRPRSLISPPSLTRQQLGSAIASLIPTNAAPSILDFRVDSLILCLQPNADLDHVHARVEAFVSVLLKRALGAQVFPVGAHPTRTFLEDDPVGVSAFLCLGQERTWFTKVAEVLFAASSSLTVTNAAAHPSGDAEDAPKSTLMSEDDDDDSRDGMLTVSSAMSGVRRRWHRQAPDDPEQADGDGASLSTSSGQDALASLENLETLLRRVAALQQSAVPVSASEQQAALTSAVLAASRAGAVQGMLDASKRSGDTAVVRPTTSQRSVASRGSLYSEHGTPLCRVRAVAFLSGKVKRITAEVDDVSVSVSANQLHELCQVAVVEEADVNIGCNHLFKRSLLLFRAWAIHDSGRAPSDRAHSASPSEPAGSMYPELIGILSRAAGTVSAPTASPRGSTSDGAAAADDLRDDAADKASPIAALSWRLCVTLMLWVFIRRRAVIHTPLQALAWLLADILSFDWDSYALSIHGAIPFPELAAASLAANISTRIDPLSLPKSGRRGRNARDGVASASAEGEEAVPGFRPGSSPSATSTQPSRFVFNPMPASSDAVAAGPNGYDPHQRVPDAAVFAVLREPALRLYRRKCARRRGPAAPGKPGTSAVPSNEGALGADGEILAPPAVQSGLASALAPVPLRVRSLCVLDVLDPLHNLADAISAREGARIKHALAMSGRSLHTALLYVHAATCTASELGTAPLLSGMIDPHAAAPASIVDTNTITGALAVVQLDSLFSKCWSRYAPRSASRASGRTSGKLAALARAQAIARDAAVVRGEANPEHSWDIAASGVFDTLSGRVEDVQRNIEYCSFLLDSEVTAPALLSLACEILSDRGPLPVGEIGKLLQEATSNLSLSAVLKERFGGLKRFLESNPDVFVLGADHPFNPHVYLKHMAAGDLPGTRPTAAVGNSVPVPSPSAPALVPDEPGSKKGKAKGPQANSPAVAPGPAAGGSKKRAAATAAVFAAVATNNSSADRATHGGTSALRPGAVRWSPPTWSGTPQFGASSAGSSPPLVPADAYPPFHDEALLAASTAAQLVGAYRAALQGSSTDGSGYGDGRLGSAHHARATAEVPHPRGYDVDAPAFHPSSFVPSEAWLGQSRPTSGSRGAAWAPASSGFTPSPMQPQDATRIPAFAPATDMFRGYSGDHRAIEARGYFPPGDTSLSATAQAALQAASGMPGHAAFPHSYSPNPATLQMAQRLQERFVEGYSGSGHSVSDATSDSTSADGRGSAIAGTRRRMPPTAAIVAAAAAGELNPSRQTRGPVYVSRSPPTAATYAPQHVDAHRSSDVPKYGSPPAPASVFSTFASGSILGLGSLADPSAGVPLHGAWSAAPVSVSAAPGAASSTASSNTTGADGLHEAELVARLPSSLLNL